MYSYPLSGFTAQSLKNILFSLYSKGSLLSKAVNGQFFVPQELCDRVYNYTNPEWIVNAMKNTPDLVGIEIRDDQLVFSVFLGNYYPSGIIAEAEVPSEVSEYSEHAETQATQQTPETQTVQAAQETQTMPATEQTETQQEEGSEVQAISVFLDFFTHHCKEVSHIQLVSPETDNERYTMRGWFNQIGWKGIEDRPLRMYFYERLSGHTAFRTEENKRKWLEARKAEKEQRQNNAISNIGEAEQPEQPDEAPECEQIETVEENIVPEQPENAESAQPEEHLAQESEQLEENTVSECEPELTEMPSVRAEPNSD